MRTMRIVITMVFRDEVSPSLLTRIAGEFLLKSEELTKELKTIEVSIENFTR